jgi:hypothetical protein
MALRLRRGTDAERQSVTPQIGELVYTIDTNKLWVGDGTPGGALVSVIGSPSELDKNLDLATFNITGNGTIGDANTSFVGDGSGLTNLPGGGGDGVIDGSTYRINIEADSSTIMVNTSTETLTGVFVGDGSGITDLGINNISEVVINTPTDGEILTYSGGQWTNLSLFDGDVKGSVFSDDSSIMLDGINLTLSVDQVYTPEIEATDRLVVTSLTGRSRLVLESVNNRGDLEIIHTNPVGPAKPGAANPEVGAGSISFRRSGSDGLFTTTGLVSYENGLLVFGKNPDIEIEGDPGLLREQASFFLDTAIGKFGIGTFGPTQALDVRGSGVFTGEVVASAFRGSLTADDSSTIVDGITGAITAPSAIIAGEVQAAAFKGTLVGDDSSIIIDGISGAITSPSYIQFGSFTTVERDAIAAANGMVVYNTTDNKFQGYEAGAWANLI